MEDYKKKYEEALERARISRLQLLAIGEEATKIETIFPELKESEDEKIRKNLITFFKNGYGTDSNARFAGFKVKDIIAWLEKQGERKPTDNIESYAFKGKLLELFQKFRWKCKDKTPTNGDILEYVDSHIQELINTVQNKSIWSEEDETFTRDA